VPEQEIEVDLAGSGLVAPRRVGDLHMADSRQQALGLGGEVAFEDRWTASAWALPPRK
jgi:hypothetical protein